MTSQPAAYRGEGLQRQYLLCQADGLLPVSICLLHSCRTAESATAWHGNHPETPLTAHECMKGCNVACIACMLSMKQMQAQTAVRSCEK